jgi:hypothetical protein
MKREEKLATKLAKDVSASHGAAARARVAPHRRRTACDGNCGTCQACEDRCFDRILLNGLIQPFQQPERVVGFFGTYRNQYPVSRDVLRDIAQQFQNWVKNRSQKWNVPILEAPEGRRDEFVEPYFRHAQPDQVVLILKAREPARILIAIGKKQDNRWHLQLAQRWIVQYNFYLNDRHWGRMFVRMSPYFPFSARLCLNQHHWLARRMQEEGIDFQQTTNAFLRCRDPHRLQDLADSLSPHDLLICGRKWLNSFTPFFTEGERKHAGCQHRLFFAQVECRVLRQPDFPSPRCPRSTRRATSGCQPHPRSAQ